MDFSYDYTIHDSDGTVDQGTLMSALPSKLAWCYSHEFLGSEPQ